MSGSLKEYGIADDWPPEMDAPEQAGAWLSLIEDAAIIVARKFPPLIEIVEGIVAEQSKLVIGSGSKSYKTWLTMDMTLSVAHEVAFLGRQTTRRRVLYVNLELKPATFDRRLQIIAKAKGISVDRDWFFHLPSRGRIAGVSPPMIISRIIDVAQHLKAGVVALDPVYKLNTAGDENSSRDQTILFNDIDRLTTEAQCTVLLNDHFGKGNQSEKEPLDAIRGSSAKGGDVDAAMVLRKHEVEDCFRVDLVHRELPPVKPFCIGWKFPLMASRHDLDPDAMKKPKAGRKPAHDPLKLLTIIKDTTAENPISISAWAVAAKVPRQTLQRYLPDFRTKGWVQTAGDGSNARGQYLTDKGRKTINQHHEET